jgi:hypothetical protein
MFYTDRATGKLRIYPSRAAEPSKADWGHWGGHALLIGLEFIGPVSKVGSAIRAAVRAEMWNLAPFARGFAIERALGGNLPPAFPIIDRFAKGVATSIKSLDLAAKSYKSAAALGRTVRNYVDKVAAFKGATHAGVTVRGNDIVRALELAVPSGGGTAAQEAALSAAVEYGKAKGVTVLIIPF